MHCYTLDQLPPPPPGKTGWPWTEVSDVFTERMPDESEWPKISIVTPSYNQGQFIEETIRSVLLQGYQNLEYIIIDGGSTDNTVDIIKKYEPWISYWVSERDSGQSDAINKGLSICSGDWFAWQNSDDYYAKNCLNYFVDSIIKNPGSHIYFGDVYAFDQYGRIFDSINMPFSLDSMFPQPLMANQGMFFHKSIFDKGLIFDISLEYYMDLDIYWNLFLLNYNFHFSPGISGFYRVHPRAKTSNPDFEFKKSEELIQVLDKYYNHPASNNFTKEKITERFIQVCNYEFSCRRFDEFRDFCFLLKKLRGWQAINLNLLVKYYASYILELLAV